jgi:hypothetical protein
MSWPMWAVIMDETGPDRTHHHLAALGERDIILMVVSLIINYLFNTTLIDLL